MNLIQLRSYILLVFFLAFSYDTFLFAQVGCPDGQGVNVLVNGNFGSSAANVLNADPGIAPGYIYTTNPPPQDGLYTITNNTTPWGSFAANWIDISDNSPDPNGYMMVVNASFDPGVFYAQQVSICGGSQYQFSADIINLLLPSLSQEILPNVDFLVDGQVFYSTGNIAQDGQWQTVGFVFSSQTNQNTVLIEIRNNAPGGQGNDLALDNIEFFTCGPLVSIDAPPVVCGSASDSIVANSTGGNFSNPVYQWQSSLDGFSWMDIPGATSLVLDFQLSENTYFRILTADGFVNINSPNCRVVSNPAFVIYSPEEVFDTLVLCSGSSLQIDDSLITSSGNYDIPLVSSFGCDSLLHLTISAAFPQLTLIFDSICIGESYNNEFYNASTVLTDSLLAQNGCDSVVIINLYVDDIDLILPFDITINQGDDYLIVPSYSGSIVLFNWSPDTFIFCPTCETTVANPLLSTLYSLNVLTAFGCKDSADINITVRFENNIYIPSAFSPNDDGINDKFAPLTNDNIVSIKNLSIYNRWGGKVFGIKNVESNSVLSEWDGTVNNKFAQEGVYVYKVDFISLNGDMISKKGELMLVR